MRPKPRYEEPFFWWGPGWEIPRSRGIGELLRDGTIDPWSAALLWAALAQRRSLAVIAGPSGSGKTTLLTALLDFLPLNTRRIHIRGCFETFAFLSDPDVNAFRTALLVNEISSHLPVYLWGPAVGRLLQAAQGGFTLLTTAHAGSVQELVAALTGSSLRIPAPQIAAIEFVVILEATEESLSGRRVQDVWRLRPTRDGVALERAPSYKSNISHEPTQSEVTHHPLWFPAPELRRRTQLLTDLRERRITALPAEHYLDGTGVNAGEKADSP